MRRNADALILILMGIFLYALIISNRYHYVFNPKYILLSQIAANIFVITGFSTLFIKDKDGNAGVIYFILIIFMIITYLYAPQAVFMMRDLL